MPIFDVHHHVGPWQAMHGREQRPVPRRQRAWLQTDYKTRVAIMERNGIDQASIMPVFGYYHPRGVADTAAMNDYVARYRQLDPRRFPLAVGTVEPLHGYASLAELERMKRKLKMAGVAFHHRFQGAPISHAIMRPYLEKMRELELIPFIHVISGSEEEAPWQLLVLTREFPDMTFVALDAFSSYVQTTIVIEIARRAPNVYWDTAFMWDGPVPGPIGRFTGEVGADRVLFGSALYASPPTYENSLSLRAVRETPISEADRQKILWKNAKRLFQL